MLASGCSEDSGPFRLTGQAVLPDCTEAPAADLTGLWSMSGDVTITSLGCFDTSVNDVLVSCPLTWDLVQTGGDLEITVDNEYLLRGRVCGQTVFLDGGFWLPVQDGFDCTYDDDSAAEVGIDSGELTVNPTGDEMTGTLGISAGCTATYAMTLFRFQ